MTEIFEKPSQTEAPGSTARCRSPSRASLNLSFPCLQNGQSSAMKLGDCKIHEARKWFVLVMLSVGRFAGAAESVSFNHGPVLTVIEENDLVVDTDRHYTQGIKLTYLSGEQPASGCLSNFSRAIPALGFTVEATRIGTQIGQSIFTPADLQATSVVTNDRPYAGWLYTGIILQRRGWTAGHHLVLENFQLDIGVIGPDSLADKAQTWVHEIRGFDLPQGWANQLRNEPGLALKYQRAVSLTAGTPAGRWVEIMPHGGFSLGNVETSVRLGSSARIGLNLPDDFGPQTANALASPDGGRAGAQTHERWSAYAFFSAEGSAIGFTEFLDGNLWHDSHHVSHEIFVGEFRFGGVISAPCFETGFALVHRSRDFHGQDTYNRSGSIYFKYRF
ncbi:MAG: lipid A deacylase LpxR family protein [Verrucomicrobia bacterium]|nr:MAG: lipid A deacylase LpxR family protein [Verrucomicrobiota bacterium]